MRNIAFSLFGFLMIAQPVAAQTVHEDVQATWKAQVIEIVSERREIISAEGAEQAIQELSVEILDGDQAGERVTVTNDFIPLHVGDRFFLNYFRSVGGGTEYYAVGEVDRSWALLIFFGLFVAAVLIFGGFHGLRALGALAASFFMILYVLLPSLLAGWPPILTSIGVSIGILAFAMSLTHGINRQSIAAFLGTMIAVSLTGVLAWAGVFFARLSGFASEEAIYLNISTSGVLDFRGLLFGAIIIAVVGLLDDIAITQATAVDELRKHVSSAREIYTKAMRIGREHVGALVNTLALAYAGTSLPLLLLFSTSELAPSFILNRELFATEIIRTVVGSIGLILTVPITTLIAIALLRKNVIE